MGDNTYNPDKLMYSYKKMEYGKERADAISYTMEQADLNNDIENMVYSREDLCVESAWYGDGTDAVRAFKEILALTGSHPDVENNSMHSFTWHYSGMDILMWMYKEIFLKAVLGFDSIPLEECQEYLIDFRKRWLAHGYSEREPYRMEIELCIEKGSMDSAGKLMQEYIKIPLKHGVETGCYTGNYVSTEIKYYLLNNEKDKAEEIADKVKHEFNFGGKSYAYIEMWRIRRIFLEYYIINGDYVKADGLAYILEHSHCGQKEFMSFASFMCAYVYNRQGRGLRIYRNYWKEWEEEGNPQYRYYTFKNAACFFKALKEVKGTDVIKLKTGSPVPSSEGDNIYSTDMLYKYYYKEAAEIAKRFDKRNDTGNYTRRLEMSVRNACTYTC